MTHPIARPQVVIILAAALLSPLVACPGSSGLFGFNPVDEDFDRPSPALAVQSAVRQDCEEPLFQKDEVFEHALCLCGDLEEVGQGMITRSNSNLKGRDPGFGHVGINGAVKVVGNFDIDGTLDVAQGLKGVGRVDVGRDLISGEDVKITGTWSVGRDAWVDGDLEGVGDLTVGRDIYLTGDLKVVGTADFDKGHLGFTYRGAPCGCANSALLNVKSEIEARRGDNDNDLIPGGVGASNLVLESGEYFFDDPQDFVGARSITVKGRAAVFVEGDIDTVGDLNITLEEGAELELWVTGRVRTVGNLRFAAQGDARPRAFRLYMGGSGSSIVNVGNASFIGSVYAPQVDIEYVGNLQVVGSLFANNLKGTGNLTIDYDTDVSVPDACIDELFQGAND